MNSELTGEVIKHGETVIQFTIHRSPRVDVSMHVKVHVMVEEFVRGLGIGETIDIRTLGRYWISIPKDAPLNVYQLSSLIAPEESPSNGFTLNKPGKPLLELNEAGQEIANLSFLRIQGISEGAGVTFGVKGIYTEDYLKMVRDKLMAAGRQFFIKYMRPMDLTVMISTQEIHP